MHRKIIAIMMLFLLLLMTAGFAYTSGGGTIQDCQTNDYDYCTVNISSTITGQDFILNNTKTTIENGASITLIRSRLYINSTELVWLKQYASIMGAGETGSDPDGGSGGSGASRYTGTPGDIDGARQGANGDRSYNAPCTPPDMGEGSGLTPFVYTSGVVGAGDYTTDSTTGGGFYASGGVFGSSIGASNCAGGYSGASGHAIKIRSALIQIDGNINVSGGAGKAGSNSKAGAGGGGGGELILEGAKVNLTGILDVQGGAGDVICSTGNCYANGGSAGKLQISARVANYSTGSVVLTGGACEDTGTATCTAGALTTVNYTSNTSTDFQAMTLSMYTANNSTITSSSDYLQFSLGIFNSSVTCWQNLSGTVSEIGIYSRDEDINIINVALPSNGDYNFAITCGNASDGITNQTTETILVHVVVVAPASDSGTTVGGGGGGGAGVGFDSSTSSDDDTADSAQPSQTTVTISTTLVGGGTGEATIAQAIVDGSKGEIQTVPFQCSNFVSERFNFYGADVVDRLTCEYKGILSLYFKRIGNIFNWAWLILLLWVYISVKTERKTTPTFYGIAVITIATLVLGFEFLTFSLAGIVIILGGGKL